MDNSAAGNRALHRGGMHMAGGFAVMDAQQRLVAGPFPSFDIGLIVARQRDLLCAQETATADAAAFHARLVHARHWFGTCISQWLTAGMPARAPLPPMPELMSIEPRILARNGAAIAAYLAEGPSGPEQPLYNRIAARYVRAAHGAVLAPATLRVALEPIHASLAMRLLCRDTKLHHVAGTSVGRALPISRADAAGRLRTAAGLFRGLDRNWLYLRTGIGVWGRWARYCRRSVMLPGVTAADAFSAARDLLVAADVRHGLDRGESSRPLRHVLLHLAQWWLVSASS